jgi:hypothetical protein
MNESTHSPPEKLILPEASETRYEFKLACEPHQVAQARNWIRLHPEGFRVAYPLRIVNNLYFDTVEQESFNHNLAGIGSRSKLRLRWYGEPPDKIVSDAILELKSKKNMFGEKRRQRLSAFLDFKRSYAAILDQIYENVPAAWHLWLDVAKQPTLLNHYRREYYVSYDGIVRVTLDYDQAAYDQRLSQRPNLTRILPTEDFAVIEIKATPDNYERLEEVMGYFPVQRSRNSKYVQGLLYGQL